MSTQSENPKNGAWRFYWESQSQLPILKLQLFNPQFKPLTQCSNLKPLLLVEKSVLELRWLDSESESEVLVRVPVPERLVIDSPLCFKLWEDYIEVKLCLLLSVDHPIMRLSFSDIKPLRMDYDVECLLSTGDDVSFYCRNCSTKLSTSLTSFEEMPSVNWREVADNWFGNCCCSFGGITENLVIRYAKSYTTTTGLCLLNTSSIILSKHDLVGFNMMNDIDTRLQKQCSFKDSLMIEVKHEIIHSAKNVPSHYVQDHDLKCCDHTGSQHSSKEHDSSAIGLLENQKSFLDGFLGNVFMTKPSNLTKDVQWVELSCPCCSCLLGAYPCGNSNGVLDSGVHLLKCYISTCLDAEASKNLFRMYTLERMFSSQLLECAKDELSFRTVVRDLQTKRPMLKIVLLNPNSWCCFGYCSTTLEQAPKINMSPAIKLLFSDCSTSDESELRMTEEWVVKNQADEVYMLASQIKELIKSLDMVKNVLPPSHTLLQGFSLSSLRL